MASGVKISFSPKSIVVASFARGCLDHFARTLEKNGLLGFYALGTRRGANGVPPERTRLKPVFGLLNYAASKCMPAFYAESFRFSMYPLFDRWVASQLQPGQHLLSSFAMTNAAFSKARTHGGVALLDAGNSHPKVFWELLTEEQKKWNSPFPPVSRRYNRRCVESVKRSDYVFAISSFVLESFVKEGWDRRKLHLYYPPTNLDWFSPAAGLRPAARPLTLLNTGAISLRKGAPYLLEAFRIVRRTVPNAILRLTDTVRDDAKAALKHYSDLPIEWCQHINLGLDVERKRYVERIQTSDIFVFPSIEDGFAFTITEAMACGVPVIVTPNAGASDLVTPGKNGEIVPIRDAQAVADAILKWWSRLQSGGFTLQQAAPKALETAAFDQMLLQGLSSIANSPP